MGQGSHHEAPWGRIITPRPRGAGATQCGCSYTHITPSQRTTHEVFAPDVDLLSLMAGAVAWVTNLDLYFVSFTCGSSPGVTEGVEW